MPEITGYPQGTPSWAELATTDEAGALAFYSALLGWEDDPQPMGPDWFYHMQRLKGLEAAALYEQSPEEKAQGVPAHWRTYFTVTNADDAVERARAAGGSVVFGPMDVFEAGRTCMLMDPQGAMFSVWQPNQHIGSRIKYETGAIMWNELLASDAQAAAQFYTTVFGTESVQGGAGPAPMEHIELKAGGDSVAGIMTITPEMGPVPPQWWVYFGVDDVDASAKQAESLGGKVIAGPADIPGVGRFAALLDPQGAGLNIFTPQ